jgi:sugar phosphate isomerase/epimerase
MDDDRDHRPLFDSLLPDAVRRERRGLLMPAPLGPADLVLCSGTLPRDTPFVSRLRAASQAGFAGISLWGRDYRAAREEGHNDADLGAMVHDHGLAVAELDPAWWWTPGAADIHIPPELDPVDIFRYDENEIMRLASLFGARSINAADVFGGSWGTEEGAEGFAALCDRAAEHGLLVHLEWLAWSKVPDLETAWEIVRLADRPNGGLNIDMWHCGRTGTSVDQLRALPPERVMAIQIDDAPSCPEDDLVRATLHDRLLPGDGQLDLVGYLGALQDIGSTAPFGVEVFSDDLHALGPEAAAQLAADATRRVLVAVDDASTS